MAVKRSSNYCKKERVQLIEIIRSIDASSILEDRSKDKTTLIKKNEMWERIERKFNASNEDNHNRSIKQLQTLWQNIKGQTKKDYAQQRRSVYLTGGGSSTQTMDEVSEAAKSALADDFFDPLQGVDDDDVAMEASCRPTVS